MQKEPQQHPLRPDVQWKNAFRSPLSRTGDCGSIRRLICKYGNIRTKTILLNALLMYFQWLNEKGVALSPDQMIEDNLRFVFESGATEVGRKRKHADWLGHDFRATTLFDSSERSSFGRLIGYSKTVSRFSGLRWRWYG
jgi:hypothetical protein